MAEDKCIFCEEYQEYKEGTIDDDVLTETEYFWAKLDPNPVSLGHTLIIPKRHIDDFLKMNPKERRDYYTALKKTKEELEKRYHPAGYNYAYNEGKAAGQTVPHLHVHIIPRYDGDVEDPTGGVRNIIPGKGNYRKKKE